MPNIEIPESVALYRQTRQPAGTGQFSAARAEAGNRHSVRISGPIYSFDGVAEAFQEAVSAVDGEGVEFDLFINSAGGDPIEAAAIVDTMGAAKGRFTAHVYGLAASSASFIAAAADRVVIGKNSRFMIHNASSGAIGGADDLRAVAEILDSLNAQMRDIYASRSGKSPEEVAGLMDDETWYLGQAAVDAGFANEVIDAEFDASADEEIVRTFQHAPNEVIEAAQAQAAGDAGDTDSSDDAASGDDTASDDAGDPDPASGDAGDDAASTSADTAPAELSADEQARIRAACAAFNMDDRADGFIEAKADFGEVKRQLWNARAEADRAIETDATNAPVAQSEAPVSQRAKLHRVGAQALRAMQGQNRNRQSR